MSRSKRRKSHNSTDIYRLINKYLSQNWISFSIFSVITFIQLLFIYDTGITILRGFISLFSTLILIQSIRGIIRLRMLKKRIFKNPDSVSISQVNDAPNIKALFWLS